MIGTPGLIGTSLEQRLTVPGMAHFAGTGPVGTSCGGCRFKGYRRLTKNGSTTQSQGCAKHLEMSKRHGAAIDGLTRSCKYFEARSATNPTA